ncbi:uncharacterized protein LOC6575705 [Drosophila mojavensis]|uniref:Uncharacterized protein n=1 Tax=Drosophila mojavensis TaxID=7230 RepID=B4KGV2_DROMO|nr:uncharacterized protein LOC6575705 [Drosophila mojavensis]EDW11152.2 uncharacterized protein Dmoj_GI16999 [Drosophila mojavensis]
MSCCCCQVRKDPCRTCGAAPLDVSCCGRRVGQCSLTNALTPYPDEIIMTILDRILYFFGATKICHLLGNPPCRSPPPVCAKSSCTSVTCTSGQMSKCSTSSSLSKLAGAKLTGNCKSKSSSLKSKSSVGQSTGCSAGPRTPHVDFAHPAGDNRRRSADSISLSDRMKLSLSKASIAYTRLKSKLSANLQHLGKKWLWTRLVRSENGCHIYEVYKNSAKEPDSCSMSGDKEPVILFLVTPNGQVMPFESLSNC